MWGPRPTTTHATPVLGRIGAAEVCHAELDGLRTQLECTGTTVADAARSFDAASANVSFVVPGADE